MDRNVAKPGTLPRAVERALEAIEVRADELTFAQLAAELAAIAPAEANHPAPAAGVLCTDRAKRIELLAIRAACGLGLFSGQDVVHLQLPDKCRRLHRRRPSESI